MEHANDLPPARRLVKNIALQDLANLALNSDVPCELGNSLATYRLGLMRSLPVHARYHISRGYDPLQSIATIIEIPRVYFDDKKAFAHCEYAIMSPSCTTHLQFSNRIPTAYAEFIHWINGKLIMPEEFEIMRKQQ